MNYLRNGLKGILLLSLLFIASTGQKLKAQDVTVSFQTFYDELSPYGQWVYDPEYGNVWVPNQGGDFRPYGSDGYWVMTDYGNTWVSGYPWGWACYHYGRWTYDPYYGWIWIPGYEWAPAWVSWRYGDGYCGWAPLGPGVSINAGYNCPESWWVFVAPTYMYHHDCIRYWRGPRYNPTYIRQTTIVNNYYVDNSTHVRYNYGPRAEVIQRDTHQPVQVYRVSRMNRPGAPTQTGNRLEMYRPAVNRNSVAEARPTNVITAPRRISSRPQPATSVTPNRQPQFHRDLPRIAPQQQRQQEQQRQMPQEQQRQQQQMQQQRQQQVEQQRQQQMQQGRQQQVEQQRQQQMQQQRQQQVEQQRQQQMQQGRQQQVEQQRQQQMQQQRQQQVEQQRQQQMQQQRQQQVEQQRQQQMQQQRQQQVEQQRQQQMQQQRQQQVEQQRQQQMQQQRQQQVEQQRQQQMQQQRQMQMEQQRQQQMQQQRQMQQQQRQAPPPQQRQAPPPPQRQGPPPQQHEGRR